MSEVPNHYQGQSGLTCADFIRDAIGWEGMEDFWRGNALKYLYRAGKKTTGDGYYQDIRKAMDCLRHLLCESSQSSHLCGKFEDAPVPQTQNNRED